MSASEKEQPVLMARHEMMIWYNIANGLSVVMIQFFLIYAIHQK